MANTFTNEQLAAIRSTGKTIVSASAGSGKTTVMIEKIINLIKDGADVSSILAVTFTKKAASQMKEKLCKAIIKAINEQGIPSERKMRLKAQLAEIPMADISTIHSFCSKLIRAHFYDADVDSAFKVIGGDDADGTALKNEALNQMLEEGYEQQEPDFMRLLSTYWRKKSDNTLRKIFLSVYEEIRNRADYREYLLHSGEYTQQTFDEVCHDLLALLQEKCAYYLTFVQEEKAYFERVQATAQTALAGEMESALLCVIQADDYFTACSYEKPKFTTNRTSKKDDAEKLRHVAKIAELKKKVVAIYDKELRATSDRETELENFLQSGETARALSKYLLAFDDKYAQLKKERGVLDYNDLEHKALALLQNKQVLSQVRGQYRYVFVDEYQDVNPVQEAIVSAIGGENVFLVGDVKQSIYGFRGSKSKFFVEKQRQLQAGEGESLKMTRNFRSSDAVLDAVNSQFSLAMTPHTSMIDYAVDSYMEKGGRYALNDGRVVLHQIPDEPKSELENTKKRGVYSVKEHAFTREIEESVLAKTVRNIIEDELKSTWYDADEGVYKPVRYRDIAVLSRKKQGRIAKTVAALAAEGVPVSSVSAVNICEFAEIKTLIDILSLLDNAEQDVPLCSALLSSMGNLTADELAAIRLAYPNETYFRRACKRYAEEYSDQTAYKLRAFFAYFNKLRSLVCVMDAGEILTKILIETRMETAFLSRENGQASIRRIHRFIEETNTERALSVHDFLTRLRDLDYSIECVENGGDDSVKVLTMHASKGLEYPIVIVDNLNAPFRGVDKDEVLVEEKFGLAPRAFYSDKMLRRETLLRRLHETKELQNSIADELNLYYVALTRARYGLHLVYEEKTTIADVKYARSFADFTNFDVWEKYQTTQPLFDVPKQERQALVFDPDEGLAREIMQAFTWKYSFAGAEFLPVKSSATALLAQAQTSTEATDGAADDTTDEKALERTRDMMAEGETNVELGLAYHAFLETFDFALLYDKQGNAVEKDVLYSRVQDALSSVDLDGVQADKLVEILSNPVFYALKDKRLYRERKFLVSLPIKDVSNQNGGGMYALNEQLLNEEVLFQGAIDLLAVDEDGAWIIDYKYSRKGKDALKASYAQQLNVYKLAVAKSLHINQARVRCSIVNIYKGYQIDL